MELMPLSRKKKGKTSCTKNFGDPKCKFFRANGHIRKECFKFREWLDKMHLLMLLLKFNIKGSFKYMVDRC